MHLRSVRTTEASSATVEQCRGQSMRQDLRHLRGRRWGPRDPLGGARSTATTCRSRVSKTDDVTPESVSPWLARRLLHHWGMQKLTTLALCVLAACRGAAGSVAPDAEAADPLVDTLSGKTI